MIKCAHAVTYKAKRKPTCAGGTGCDTCNAKWKEAVDLKAINLGNERVLTAVRKVMIQDLKLTKEDIRNEMKRVVGEVVTPTLKLIDIPEMLEAIVMARFGKEYGSNADTSALNKTLREEVRKIIISKAEKMIDKELTICIEKKDAPQW